MMKLQTYSYSEMEAMINSRGNQAIKRKLERYGIEFDFSGRGKNSTYTIKSIANEFKVFCILELDMGANTDFSGFAYFVYYFLNDDDFRWLPDEIIEIRLRDSNQTTSRQTIANYKQKLRNLELFITDETTYTYYFAKNKTQIITDEKTYKRAWHEYWKDKENGADSGEAIYNMCINYGGVARKQPHIIFNGIYKDLLNTISKLSFNEIIKSF